jgi:transcriptional regulator with XRE-family HTH domain
MPVRISLRAARVNAGFLLKEAAHRLGISCKTLGNWEKGITFPPADKIPAICELYGVSYDNLNFLPSDSLKANK